MIEPRLDSKPLILHNAGEPFLHPQLANMVSLAAKGDVPTEISTNAGLLTLDSYKKLSNAGIARIVIALDGTDVETLNAIRGPGARPQKAFVNIDDILNYRAAHQSTLPFIVIQMVKMRANAHQHERFLDQFGNLGLPGVSAFLKPVEAPSGSPLLMPGTRPPQHFCTAPWQTLGIYWDGSVVPCCYDLNASLCIGNVNHHTLTEIWEGDAIAALRERIKTNKCTPNDLCAICHHRPDRYQMPDLNTIQEVPDAWY
jgi:radical SAM protein with 4Fe4S-binding SPASM domain